MTPSPDASNESNASWLAENTVDTEAVTSVETGDIEPDHNGNEDNLNTLSLGSQSTRSNGAESPPNGKGSPMEPIIPPHSDLSEAMVTALPQTSTSLSRREHQISARIVVVVAIAIVTTGLLYNDFWLILAGSIVSTVVSTRLVWPSLRNVLAELTPQQQTLLIAVPGTLLGLVGLMQISGLNRAILQWGQGIRWDVIGALGDFLGAFGQILIALLAVYVAWRQYVISRDLTVQQNRITQQQTIDAYFQGISDLVLDDEGLLEDWPQERSIAEARTAAILSSINAAGKAKVIRFLSGSKLLTPLKRDRRLGRPILDGAGGYAEERGYGTRVIDLGVMLAASDLSGTDLRWTDLSDANLIRANLQGCDLVRANLARTILVDATLAEADIMGARLFYGDLETASPRTRNDIPNYQTGAYTGAVIEGADFSSVQRLSEKQRCYCCTWGGNKTRATIPGGCDNLPNLLGH